LVRRDYTLNGADSIVYDGELSQVQAIQNAASAFVYGVQTGVEVKLPNGFAILSRFNYQKGVEELDDGTTSPLRHAGPWFGSTHFTFTRNKLKVDLYAIYNGEISNANLATEEQGKEYLYAADENGLPYAPSWYTLNLKAMFRFDKYFQVSAGLENLTNQRYRPYSSGLAGAGTNFIFSVRGSF
jgi:hemoglobin/transferrin/lactoferrin receptor protein